ncbi:hypothetical protein [Pseudomonas sp. BF-RE-26]|uniref:hypothetical protein n=1 Tax=Pseudomonas sp. BF-RE-26 TaxID=2832396 RepID=UPI001CC04E6F|nr:hypothetical protein [Pseudomonas sp. BF-RE-26]
MNGAVLNTIAEHEKSIPPGATSKDAVDEEKKENGIAVDASSADVAADEVEEKGIAEPREGTQKIRTDEFKLNIKDQWRDKSHEELKEEIESQLKEQGLSDAPAEFIDQLVRKVSNHLSKKKRWQRFRDLFSAGVIVSVLITLATFSALISQTADRYVSREELRAALTNAIMKDSNIDDVKLVYQHEVSNPSESIWPLIKPHLYYEKNSLTLLQALNDLKVLKLTTVKSLEAKDVEFVHQVNTLVLDHNKFNPFDGLDEQSLRDFRGISIKLTEPEYEKIKDELLNLNSAIKEKNSLIGQYLSSSNLSLYVSMGAFLFSIIVTIWQFFPKGKSSHRQLIAEAIEAINEQRDKHGKKG